jgi:subtilase family serine protease
MKRIVVFAVGLSILLVASWASAQVQGRKFLPGHVPAAVGRLVPAGRLAASKRLVLAIGLPVRNRDELASFLNEIYDPASPNYRHYLTPEQFTARFGPTEEDYAAVIAFARTNGLEVIGRHPNRLLLNVGGSVADIERAFRVTLRLYQHPAEGRQFFAPDTEPSVASGLPIADVSGLNNYDVPHPLARKQISLEPRSNATPNAGSAGGAYQPMRRVSRSMVRARQSAWSNSTAITPMTLPHTRARPGCRTSP